MRMMILEKKSISRKETLEKKLDSTQVNLTNL
jgi:hypothetical protein